MLPAYQLDRMAPSNRTPSQVWSSKDREVLCAMSTFPLTQDLKMFSTTRLAQREEGESGTARVTPAIWAHLSRLPCLRKVSLHFGTEDDLEGIFRLDRLSFLRLVPCPEVSLTVSARLPCLSALHTLEIDGSRKAGQDLSFVSRLKSLRSLNILHWCGLTEAEVCHWARLPLETVAVKSCVSITPGAVACIACMPKLRDLALLRTRVTEEGIRYLTALTALSRLRLTTKDVPQGCERLFSRLKGLKLEMISHYDPLSEHV